jgi:hypothetical protein
MCTPLLSPICTIYSIYLIPLDFIIQKILGEEYRSLSSSLTHAGITAEKYFRISQDINVNKIGHGQFSTLNNIYRKSEEMKIISRTQCNMFDLQ